MFTVGKFWFVSFCVAVTCIIDGGALYGKELYFVSDGICHSIGGNVLDVSPTTSTIL